MELSILGKKLSTHFSARMHSIKALENTYQSLLLAMSSCDLCGSSCQHYQQLCDHCYYDLPLFNQEIIHGDLLNWPSINKDLPNVSFDQLICLAPHCSPFDNWLHQFKYLSRFELAQLFTHLLADKINELLLAGYLEKPQLMLAVPLHISRWQHRGYNQAHLIATKLAQRLEKKYAINYKPQLISRSKATVTQVGKTGRQRRKNLRSAFTLAHTKSLPEHVMLIDDVVTTGATASEISSLLKQHGVKRVTLVTLTLAMRR